MDEKSEQLVAYIKQQLAAGVPANVVWQTLLQAKWQPELVERSFALVQAPQAAPPLPGTPHRPAALQASLTSEKYRIFAAVRDTIRAIRNNTNNFGLALIIGHAISIATLLLISFISYKLFYSDLDLLFASPLERVGMALGSFGLHLVWLAIHTYATTITLLAVYDGSQQRVQPVGMLFKYGLTRMKRMVAGTMLTSLITLWPVALLILLPIATIDSSSSSSTLITMTLISLFTVIWVYIAYMRLALVPYVILFEPQTPVIKSFGRSKRLLHQRGGQWFLLKGVLLLAVICFGLSFLSHDSFPMLFTQGGVLLNAIFFVLSIIAEIVLVMLYRNRAALYARNNGEIQTIEEDQATEQVVIEP